MTPNSSDTPATDERAEQAEANTNGHAETPLESQPVLAEQAPEEVVEDAPGPGEPAAEETPAADAGAAQTGAAPTEIAPAASEGGDDSPAVGPKIITDWTPPKPTPAPPPAAHGTGPVKAEKPRRRRRLNATQRHRNLFFARLNEFRRAQATGDEAKLEDEQNAEAAAEATDDAPAPEATETPVTEATETPAGDSGAEQAVPEEGAATPAPAAGEEPAESEGAEQARPEDGAATPAASGGEDPAEGATTGSPEQPAAEQGGDRRERRNFPPPAIDRPRLVAAIDRAGGPEVVAEALQPKRDENNQPLKWATVCADACKGLKTSDPIFTAWVRLAATPVSAIKAELGLPTGREERGRGRGRGPRRDGGGRPPRRDDFGRTPRDRISREELERLGTGGSVGANIRIIGPGDDDKKEREQRRKQEREAKRQAERDRLSRLGY